MLNIGHRGAAGHEPENTLRSIRAALEMGADGIEVDVYSVGGELMVIHDETLDRTTNGSGRVEKQSLEYLRSLDAGHGEKIPTLREVFDTVDHRAFVNIELKGPRTGPLVADLVSEYVDKHGWKPEEFLLSSFEIDELRSVMNRGIRLGVLFGEPPVDCIEIAKSLGAYSLNIHWKHANSEFLKKAHGNGLKVFVYTVNELPVIESMRSLGVDGVFSDYPDRVS